MEVSLPQWICLWRAFGNMTLWMFSLLLISFALGPQSPCSRNLWALLSIFLINPGLREIWGLVDCWTPYVSGAMLEFPCYKEQRKSRHLLRIWLRPLNLLVSIDQKVFKPAVLLAWINAVSFIQGLQQTSQTVMNELKYKSYHKGKRETASISQLGKLRNT